jgi:hypothetical protein
MSRHKHRGDGEKVFCKLTSFAATGIDVRTEYHELSPMLRKDPFHEFRSKAAQPVLSGNHHLLDSSCVYPFQNGCKTPAFPVEA